MIHIFFMTRMVPVKQVIVHSGKRHEIGDPHPTSAPCRLNIVVPLKRERGKRRARGGRRRRYGGWIPTTPTTLAEDSGTTGAMMRLSPASYTWTAGHETNMLQRSGRQSAHASPGFLPPLHTHHPAS